MEKKPEPYAYVLLAVIVIAAILLIPVVLKISFWLLKVVLICAIFGFAIFGIYTFVQQKNGKK